MFRGRAEGAAASTLPKVTRDPLRRAQIGLARGEDHPRYYYLVSSTARILSRHERRKFFFTDNGNVCVSVSPLCLPRTPLCGRLGRRSSLKGSFCSKRGSSFARERSARRARMLRTNKPLHHRYRPHTNAGAFPAPGRSCAGGNSERRQAQGAGAVGSYTTVSLSI